MKIKGKIEKVNILLEDTNIELKADMIKDISCSDIYETLNINSDFDEYEADYFFISIDKKADIFINKDGLKGTLFTVLPKHSITAIEIYTSEEKYKIYTVQEIVETKYAYDVKSNQFLSNKKGYEETVNVAQAYGEDEEGNLAIIISQENADRAFGQEDRYD